jgi:hypothetical protein
MRPLGLVLVLAVGPAAVLAGGAVDGLQAEYRATGAGPFSPDAGATAWQRPVPAGDGGVPRSCVACHGADPRGAGRHAVTGKVIDPLAPAANPTRLSDLATIEKWFRRNCDWTWGRACTPQEKGDFLSFLGSFRP